MRRRRLLTCVLSLGTTLAASFGCGGEEFTSDSVGTQVSDDRDGSLDGSSGDVRHDTVSEGGKGGGGLGGSAGIGGSGAVDAHPLDGAGGAAGDALPFDARTDSNPVTDAPVTDAPMLDAPNDTLIPLDATLPDGGCVPTVFYFDNDKDHYGGTQSQSACVAPSEHWVTLGGDCDDNNGDVNPGQAGYFDAPYTRTGTQVVTYDYNCSGSEELEKPSTPRNSGTCSLLSGGLCSKSGYLDLPRMGTTTSGTVLLCGSTTIVNCVGLCSASTASGQPAVLCH